MPGTNRRLNTNADKLQFRGDNSQFECRWANDEVEALAELSRRKNRRKPRPAKKDKPVTLPAAPWDTP